MRAIIVPLATALALALAVPAPAPAKGLLKAVVCGADGCADVTARIRLGATPDVVVGSVHAVTEDGILVVGSASGSQLAPYASGAQRAIWVVGTQKVVPDLDTALRRLRTPRAASPTTGTNSIAATVPSGSLSIAS